MTSRGVANAIVYLSIVAALCIGSYTLGYVKGVKAGKLELLSALVAETESPKDQWIRHDVCFAAGPSTRCLAVWLNGQSEIAEGQVLTRQPDGSWYYQDGVIQVLRCFTDCEVKG